MTLDFPPLPPRNRRRYEVPRLDLGLFLDRSKHDIPEGGLSDCLNVRLRDGYITSEKLGWESMLTTDLLDPVVGIHKFETVAGSATTIFGTKRDLVRFDPTLDGGDGRYITPIYTAGTATFTNGSATVIGTTTTWLSNLKAGDFIHATSSTENRVSATWYEIQSVDTNNQVTLTANFAEATQSNVAYTARKIFTGGDFDYWVDDTFPDAPLGSTSGLAAGDHWFATNGNELVVWDGSANTVVLLSAVGSGLGFSCGSLAYYKNMMLFGSVTDAGGTKPTSIKNTAIGDPENITTLEAGEFIAAESVDFIQSLRRLGDLVAVYCEDSISVVQFVGAPIYFSVRTVSTEIGVFSGRAIVDFGTYHEFIGKDRGYRFDGVRMIPFGDHVIPAVLQNSDRGRPTRCLAARSLEEEEVYWVVPQIGEDSNNAEYAWTEHYSEPVRRGYGVPFMKRTLPATSFGLFEDESSGGRFSDYTSSDTFQTLAVRFNDRVFTASLDVVVFGTETGKAYKLNTGSQVAHNDLSTVFSPRMAMFGNDARGVVSRVELYTEYDQGQGLTFQTQVTDRREDNELDNEFSALLMDQSALRYEERRHAGRYVLLGLYSLAGTVWSISGYQMTFDQIGDYE